MREITAQGISRRRSFGWMMNKECCSGKNNRDAVTARADAVLEL